MPVAHVLRMWLLVEHSFLAELHTDLEDAIARGRSWRWFRTHLTGLIASDTAIGRYFRKDTVHGRRD